MKILISIICIYSLFNLDSCLLNLSPAREGYIKNKFSWFVEKFNKSYFLSNDTAEYEKRLPIFAENFLEMERQVNSRRDNLTYILGINHFADITHKEFTDKYINYKLNSFVTQNTELVDIKLITDNIKSRSNDKSFTWRENVSERNKNQGICNLCASLANYTETNNRQDCNIYDKDQDVSTLTVSKLKRIENVTEEQLLDLVRNIGPICVLVNPEPFHFYKEGPINNINNTFSSSTESSVLPALIVGYNSTDWKLTSYLGDVFIDKGYFNILRDNNTIGIGNYALTTLNDGWDQEVSKQDL